MGDPANPFRPGVILLHQIVPGPVKSGIEFRQFPTLVQRLIIAPAQVLNAPQDGGHGLLYPAGVPKHQEDHQQQVEHKDHDGSHQKHHQRRRFHGKIVFYQGIWRKARYHQGTVLPAPHLHRVVLKIPAAEGRHLGTGIGPGQLLGKVLLPDHRAALIQKHGPGVMLPQHGQRRVIRRPCAGLLCHMAGNRPDRQPIVCPTHISGD